MPSLTNKRGNYIVSFVYNLLIHLLSGLIDSRDLLNKMSLVIQ